MRRSPLLKLLAVNGVLGAGAALLLVLGLVAFDAHGLRTLLMGADVPWVAVILLTFGLTVTMSSVAMGIAIMTLPREEPSDPRGGAAAPVADLQPATVAARRR